MSSIATAFRTETQILTLTLTLSLMKDMAMTYTHAKSQGQRSLGLKVRVYIDRGDCITHRANVVGKNILCSYCWSWLTAYYTFMPVFLFVFNSFQLLFELSAINMCHLTINVGCADRCGNWSFPQLQLAVEQPGMNTVGINIDLDLSPTPGSVQPVIFGLLVSTFL